ncbi:MAG: class II aldolase/adducin family protein [Desulfurococcales archaeon]|nr:class II aldolase/adducin family protein [Desulfurococcales archaeon]
MLEGDPREDLATVMRLLYTRGLVQVRGGNASIVDRSRGLVYITPTGVPRHLVSPRDIALITLDGDVVEGSPSSEWRMHVAIYRVIQDASAIVHAHPPHTIAAGELGGLDVSLTTEASYNITCISLAPPLTPGTWSLAESVAKMLSQNGCNVAIMRRHGVVAYSSKTVYHALDAVEAVEDLAKIHFLMRRF